MKLLVVSQNGCNPCTMVKNFLNNENVEYETLNISTDDSIEIDGEKITVEDLGVMGTPVTILLDDELEEVTRIMGFSPPDLETLISQL